MQSAILKELNDEQKKAATHVDGPMLILAGAGSGKTKTITTRLAYLISEVGIPPSSTLTLTFTNKAANEMRQRALSMIDNKNSQTPPLLCTFHKFGLLFLKFYISKLNRKNNFLIIDTDDKKKIIKSFESDIATSILASEISKFKNSLISADEALENANLFSDDLKKEASGYYKKVANVYKKYEDTLRSDNLVDFDDLLVLPYQILSQNPDLCDDISNRYQYIMVDEYQDTNDLQFKLLSKLCKNHNNLCVVGDDDQSIYGWRGARVENILNFKDQFENVKIIRLEKNYRSSQHILNAANNLIDYNRNRLGKKLTSTKEKGSEIEIYQSDDENYEANKIAKKITKLISNGVDPKEIAVLYRVNALSRALEDGLTKARIPYKMVGGMKFYERAEIKDAISYIRLILNNNDDFSLRRIINRPKRGLGKVSLAKIEKIAFDNKLSLFNAIATLDPSDVSKKSFTELGKFVENITNLNKMESLYDLINELESNFGLKEYYKELSDGGDRVANIDEFYAMLKDEIINNANFDLEEFLNELSLTSEQDALSDEAISIMSVHASKGLEFEYLFVIGLEEGFFPLISDGNDIEEERRLGYVAITRAKKELVLSHSNSRFYRGRRERLDKSRFLSEAGLCEGSLKLEKTADFKKGDLVKHKLFGIGRVTSVTKVKKDSKLKINFGGIFREIMSNFVEKVA
ncbi:UvrD/REP family helicase [Campylobacter blaseri]|uniref:DNA 3'-5' helicase n=1 Tax=Campylobacter blaseri TaxID=2042961 RepID=A0A2P8R1W6_9BACT|nr:UvrD-helicase domain-containing protein [Campylobacter blaseri]PSM52499.1 ATP-dependent DNA helicase [Campylobacter blaseri]PSM54147.1 ATP-dependent DNA helicase [Campylobacter blaseri]QKF85795.1 UvrD/REP family helicase [Campylobacter blaseri]